MDRLRAQLRECTKDLAHAVHNLPGYDDGYDFTSDCTHGRYNRLACIAPGVFACLIRDTDIFIFHTSPTAAASKKSFLLELDGPLPAGCNQLIPSPTEHGLFGVCGLKGAAVVEHTNNSNAGKVIPVGSPTFKVRPGLQILHAAWSPHTDAFLALLTSDGNLRVFDVSSKQSANVDKFRLRVVTSGAGPVSFAFGRGSDWDTLSIYVLAEDGKIYVAAPVALVGTKIAIKTWRKLLAAAQSVLEKESCIPPGNNDNLPGEDEEEYAQEDDDENLASLGFDVPAKRQLNFSASRSKASPAASNGATNFKSWNVKQAEIQIEFLESVFAGSHSSHEMIVVNEFETAQPLFQGPFFVEQEDTTNYPNLDDVDSDDNGDNGCAEFADFTLLQHGLDCPPVFLRSTTAGETSVLIQLESVDAQWRLGNNDTNNSNSVAEYQKCAEASAPSLLCFEHLSFPKRDPVKLFRLPGKADFHAVFAACGSHVYSVRLPFISLMNDNAALQDCPVSTIAPVLDMAPDVADNNNNESTFALQGVTQTFERGIGLVAIVLDNNFSLSASPPLRWDMNVDIQTLLPPVIEPASELSSWSSGMQGGTRGFTSNIGREVTDALQEIRELQQQQGWNVAEGTITTLGEAENSAAKVLAYMEDRVVACVGSDMQSGVGDLVTNASSLVKDWINELGPKSNQDIFAVQRAGAQFNAAATAEEVLAKKIERAAQLNNNLRERIDVLREILECGSGLSAAERERQLRLRERKRRHIALKKRLAELAAAVAAVSKESERPRRRQTETNMAMSMTPDRNSNNRMLNGWGREGATWKTSPLEKRRDDWNKADKKMSLGKDELERVKNILEAHSEDIAGAHEKSKGLWSKLNAA